MSKPLIGIISKSNIFFDEFLFNHHMIYDRLIDAILKNGGIAIAILPTQTQEDRMDSERELTENELKDLHNALAKCDGIILQGGAVSHLYEMEVAKYAINNNCPILGICAGFNNIVRAMGGTTFSLDEPKHYLEDGRIVHKNIIIKNSLLYNILKNEEVEVNSIHKTFAKKEDIKNLDISAYSEDGYVEAVEKRNHPFCLGLKWHPEFMRESCIMNEIFKQFIKTCQK